MFFKYKNRNIICIFSILFLILIIYLWANPESFETTIPASTVPIPTGGISTTPMTSTTTSTTPMTSTTKPMTSTTSPMTTHGYKISKNPQTNLYQQNFDGTSNVYSPYIYHNMEAFTPLNLYDDKLSQY